MPSDPSEFDLRNELISRARVGEITPQQAEAEAAAHGLAPFEHEPGDEEFNPLLLTHWSLVMAIAWIVWRDLKLVRRHEATFRAHCTHWIFRHWNEVLNTEPKLRLRDGWFLENLHEATVPRLGILEVALRHNRTAPKATMTAQEAEKALWSALVDGRLAAEALNHDGRPVDISPRDWSYLQLFEERERDVLKFRPLDRDPAFEEIKLRRHDLLRLWPTESQPPDPAERPTDGPIDETMLAPILTTSPSGYVPLCVAVHWIITHGNTRQVSLGDRPAWDDGCRRLFDSISSGSIELIGLRNGQALTELLPGHLVTVASALHPFHYEIGELLQQSRPYIACAMFVDHETWSQHFNDRFFQPGNAVPTWTHLQVKTADIIAKWPRPTAKANIETQCYHWLLQAMRESPTKRPQGKAAFFDEARKRYRGLAKKQFDRAWDKARVESGADWSKPGPTRSRSDPRAN